MGSIRYSRAEDLARYEGDIEAYAELFERPRTRKPQRRQAKRSQPQRRSLRRDESSRPFKCHHCKAFIGMPVSGGKHRNHCPNCLYSLHIDAKTPGDRRSDCRSLMEPVGTAFKADGEQTVVHRCRGCGIERYNRIAADDSPLLLMQLPVVSLSMSGERGDEQDVDVDSNEVA